MFQWFPIFVGDLPLLELADAQVRYDNALRLEIVGKIAGALAADHHWTERLSLIPDSTYAFLDRDVTENFLKCSLDRGGRERDAPYSRRL